MECITNEQKEQQKIKVFEWILFFLNEETRLNIQEFFFKE